MEERTPRQQSGLTARAEVKRDEWSREIPNIYSVLIRLDKHYYFIINVLPFYFRVTESSVEPLKVQLVDLEQQISDQVSEGD